MFKLFNKIQFPKQENRMRTIGDTKKAREIYNSSKSKNLKFLLMGLSIQTGGQDLISKKNLSQFVIVILFGIQLTHLEHFSLE